jgi:hypothetical protein
MNAPRKLALFAVALAGVLGLGMAVGSAAEPIGLSNATPDQGGHGGEMADGMVPGLGAADDDLRIVAERDTVAAGAATDYRFRIDGEDGPVDEFDIEHTKPMHLIVVRRDFAGFQHLHPQMEDGGTWTTPLTIDAAGVYRVYADFVVDGEKHTLATDLFVGGEFRPESLAQPAGDADAGDGYTVHLDGAPIAGEESALDFRITRDGEPVDDLQEYLGARGHLVALRDGDLGYLHVHADEDRLHFEAEFPTPGAYRLFLQFRHDGEVRTAAITVDVAEESR